MKLVETFAEFKAGKNIDRPTMMRVLEDVFRSLIRKKYGSDENFNIIVNTQKGDLEMWRVRAIVPDGEVTDDLKEIAISEALVIDEDYEVGLECYEQLSLEDFGRRAIMAARQTLVSRIMELEKDDVFKRYSEREGELVIGEVNQVLKRELLIIDDATNIVRAVIKKVELKNSLPVIHLSRTDSAFLQRLMEQEVPEIEDGLIVIKKIVRLPGERAKVAVESFDDRIDPVGACVGMKGSRIHGIVRELRNENIDIVNYTNNLSLYVQRSLTPAKINSIEFDEKNKKASVYLKADQLSLAIGKGGANIKLASKLTGYEIDVFRDQEEGEVDDVDLDEFKDEIEEWIIDALKNIGCDTARSVLNLSTEELARRTDLEEETIKDVMDILTKEFEE